MDPLMDPLMDPHMFLFNTCCLPFLFLSFVQTRFVSLNYPNAPLQSKEKNFRCSNGRYQMVQLNVRVFVNKRNLMLNGLLTILLFLLLFLQVPMKYISRFFFCDVLPTISYDIWILQPCFLECGLSRSGKTASNHYE